MKKRVLSLLLAVLCLTGSLGGLTAAAAPGSPSAGDVVTFGRYPRGSGAAEPIEWTVLDVRDGKALLISRELLAARWYHSEYDPVTWEQSSLRAWLNDAFLNNAFTKEERGAIVLTDVDNSDAQGNSTYTHSHGGNDTRDYVFLLSRHEAFEVYFAEDADRICLPTDQAVADGASASWKEHSWWWWLRSPGSSQAAADAVTCAGAERTLNVDHGFGGVRPCLWADISSGLLAPAREEGVAEGKAVDAAKLKGTWFGFEPADEHESGQASEFRLIRFDAKKKKMDMIRSMGYYPDVYSCTYEVSGDTLVCTDENGYTEEFRIAFADGKLILDRDGICALVPVKDGNYPDDPAKSAFLGENKLYWISPREDGTIAVSGSAEGAESLKLPGKAFGIAITAVGADSFRSGESLKSVTVPEGVTAIGSCAFSDSYALESVKLPSTLRTIGYEAFEYCGSLKEIVIPEGTESIGESAFYSCEQLVSVTLPNSLKNIGDYAFGGSESAAVFTVRQGSPAETWCRENKLKYLAVDKKGKVVADERVNVHVRDFLWDGFTSIGSLFFAADHAIEEGADPAKMVKEMRAIAEENGVLDYFLYTCESIAAQDSKTARTLLEMAEREDRELPWYDEEGPARNSDVGFSAYEIPEVSDALRAALKDSSAQLCVKPFFWTESEIKKVFGTAFSKFKPKKARPGYICVVVGANAQSRPGVAWDKGGDRTDRFTYTLRDFVSMFNVGAFTGNPQLASSFWVFNVSYPYYARYGEQGEVKGYNCVVTLTVIDAASHRKVAEFSYTSELGDTIFEWENGIAQADLPQTWDLDGDEIDAFRNKLQKYIDGQTGKK